MTGTTKATHEHRGVRWASDRLANGGWLAYAWVTGSEHPDSFAEASGHDSERAAFDGLRVALLKHFRAVGIRSTDFDSIVNDRGDRLDAICD